MLPPGCLNATLTIVAACLFISVVQGTYNVSEPDRKTLMYGRDFIVALPPDGWKMEASFLKIACVSGGYDPRANGSINLIGKNHSKMFTAAPTVSIDLMGFKPFLQSTNTSVLEITSDSDIIVTLILQIGQTLSAYTALPVKSLDKVYLVASYGLLEDNLSELTVVGTSPAETSVQFTSNAYNATLSPNLLHGESHVYETDSDFIGGHLQCTDPVMGVVGSRCSDKASGCSAQSMDSLYPLFSLGTRYTVVNVDSLDVSGTFRAVAVWNNTYISWSTTGLSNSRNVTLANGQTIDLNFGVDETCTIIGSKPFLLLHHLKRGTPASDIALVTVPPHEQLTRKTITFSTYMHKYQDQQPPRSFITIINPCHHDILLQHISLSEPRTVSTDSLLPTVVHLGADEKVCGSSRELELGVYTLEVSPDDLESSYTAILYTVTETGVAAHILATELNQVVCSVEPSEKVNLCPTTLITTPLPTAVTANSTTGSKPFVTTTPGGEKRSSSGGTIIAVVVVILSLVAGATVIGIIMFRYCRSSRWKRLEEADYMEDNPIRLQVLEQGL